MWAWPVRKWNGPVAAGAGERRDVEQRSGRRLRFPFFLFSVFCCVAVFLKRFAGCRVALRNLYKYFVVIYECENVCVWVCVCSTHTFHSIHFGAVPGKGARCGSFPAFALNSPLLLASAQNGRLTAVISRRAGDLPWLRGRWAVNWQAKIENWQTNWIGKFRDGIEHGCEYKSVGEHGCGHRKTAKEKERKKERRRGKASDFSWTPAVQCAMGAAPWHNVGHKLAWQVI